MTIKASAIRVVTAEGKSLLIKSPQDCVYVKICPHWEGTEHQHTFETQDPRKRFCKDSHRRMFRRKNLGVPPWGNTRP